MLGGGVITPDRYPPYLASMRIIFGIYLGISVIAWIIAMLFLKRIPERETLS
jgi:hypothetical protein